LLTNSFGSAKFRKMFLSQIWKKNSNTRFSRQTRSSREDSAQTTQVKKVLTGIDQKLIVMVRG